MNTIAYTALLYGKDYLGDAILSVINHIDQYHVIYSPEGAHGHRTDRPCPDTHDELYALAEAAAGPKLRWHDAGPFPHEGAQRDSIHAYAPDADVILVLDADEIWGEELVSAVLNYAGTVQYSQPVRTFRLPIIHFWRSFYRAVLHDPAFPTRVIFPRIDAKYGEKTVFTHKSPIAHLGYAQRSEIVEFKQHTHGHKGEWRRDVDWFRDRFMANAQHDCHPVGSEWWNPEPVDPWQYLPDFMKSHPYANLDVIP